MRQCTYAVSVHPAATDRQLRNLARSLSGLSALGCEVLIIDSVPAPEFRDRQRILRWVGRHVNVIHGDLLRAAADLASCEKVIVASPESRCSAEEIAALCNLLEVHEVVEPEEYVAPLRWWGGVEAGGLLLHRGADLTPQMRSTIAFRRSAFRPLRGSEDDVRNAHLRRLILQGAEVYTARELFVRREPQQLAPWFRDRTREAAADLALRLKATFFFGLIPVVILLALIGGLELAGAWTAAVSFAAVLLAVRGRAGATRFFPLRACLYAPMWIAARTFIVYWALFERMRRARALTSSAPRPAGIQERKRYTGEVSPS